MKRLAAVAAALLGLMAAALGQAWLFSPGGVPSAGGFVPTVDPNWWQNFQYAGTNPSVVLDFANGLYYNGTTTLTSPSTLVSGGTVTAGSGLAGATGVTASGALLTAMKATTFNVQLNTVAGSASSNLGLWAEDIGGPNGVLTNTGGQVFAFPTNLTANAGSNFSLSNWVNYSQTTSVRQISLIGPGGGTVSAAGVAAADTNNFATPNTVFLGSWNGGFPFDGFLSSFAVLPAVLPNKAIPPRAFTGKNGWWWNGDITNSGITYGNILQFEYTQPWTVIAAVNLNYCPGSMHTGVSGIIYTNVTAGTPFPGHEFWVDGICHLTVRIINDDVNHMVDVSGGTNMADGKWHVVAETYTGSGLASGVAIYVDGVPETLTVNQDNLGGNTIVASGQSYQIGQQQSQSFAFPGAIGFFRHYTGVKTQAFIQNFKINMTLPPVDATCALGPRLNEGGSSTTTGDFCSGNHTGTMNNANQWLRG